MGAPALLGGEACRRRLAAIIAVVEPHRADALADRLILEFGGFHAVLDASPERIRAVIGGELEIGRLLSAMNDGMAHVLLHRLSVRPVISDSQVLAEYLRFKLGSSRLEQFRALYLNVRNYLIRDELVASGTFNQVTIYPRQIVKRALELDADGIIVVHNHPSGDPAPSDADRRTTRALSSAARALEIRLMDHVIVGRDTIISLRGLGHL